MKLCGYEQGHRINSALHLWNTESNVKSVCVYTFLSLFSCLPLNKNILPWEVLNFEINPWSQELNFRCCDLEQARGHITNLQSLKERSSPGTGTSLPKHRRALLLPEARAVSRPPHSCLACTESDWCFASCRAVSIILATLWAAIWASGNPTRQI